MLLPVVYNAGTGILWAVALMLVPCVMVFVHMVAKLSFLFEFIFKTRQVLKSYSLKKGLCDASTIWKYETELLLLALIVWRSALSHLLVFTMSLLVLVVFFLTGLVTPLSSPHAQMVAMTIRRSTNRSTTVTHRR